MGAESFGKGSVQSVIPLADGSGLRLTTAKYYTPSGRTFHRDEKTGKGGITPDILIDVPRETESKLQAQDEEILGKPKIESKPDAKEKTKDSDKTAKDADKDKPQPVVDDALNRAMEILKSREIFLKNKDS
jgi:carboxyl-terminal processing protease